MKILILGAFLIISFGLKGQQFVSTQDALTILSEKDAEDRLLLNNGQLEESSTEFADIKYNVKSYYILTSKLNGGETVVNAVRETVFEIKNGGITDQEYNNDTIGDNDLSRIKDNLEKLLTQ